MYFCSHFNVVAFLSIDWHDFVLVQTIELTDADEQQDLPAPTTVEAVQNMTIIQRKSLFAADTQQTSIGAAATTATSLPQVGGPPQPGTAAVVDEEDDMDMDME